MITNNNHFALEQRSHHPHTMIRG